jgi:hypothetical protein
MKEMKLIIISLLILVCLYIIVTTDNVTTETYCNDNWDGNCKTGCGRPYAGASDSEMVCCPDGTSTYPSALGLNYCKNYMQSGTPCWLDEMCVNGNCKGNGEFAGIAWSGTGICN